MMVNTKVGGEKPSDTEVPFKTPTLAEIFVKQGFLSKGLKIYRQLACKEPDNFEFTRKIKELSERIRLEGEDRKSEAGLPVFNPFAAKIPVLGQCPVKEPAERGNDIVADGNEKTLKILNRWLDAIQKRKKHVQ